MSGYITQQCTKSAAQWLIRRLISGVITTGADAIAAGHVKELPNAMALLYQEGALQYLEIDFSKTTFKIPHHLRGEAKSYIKKLGYIDLIGLNNHD